MRCQHCNQEYKTVNDFIKDCFVSSDGWSWDYFHNCLKDKGDKNIKNTKEEVLQIDRVMERLNKYDYKSEKSAQEALGLLHDLKEIFNT